MRCGRGSALICVLAAWQGAQGIRDASLEEEVNARRSDWLLTDCDETQATYWVLFYSIQHAATRVRRAFIRSLFSMDIVCFISFL